MTHARWTTSEGDEVMLSPKAGGAPETIAAGQDQPEGLTLDATHLYWVNARGNQLMRLSRCGCGL